MNVMDARDTARALRAGKRVWLVVDSWAEASLREDLKSQALMAAQMERLSMTVIHHRRKSK